VRNSRRRWFETAWPRDKKALRTPKVIALYRTDRGRFALDESGEWQPSIKTTVCTAREQGLSVAYLCGLLNSELLDLWYAVRGKSPRDVWRNYEPKPMSRIPYRHVERLASPADAARLQDLEQALAGGDAALARALAEAIAGELTTDETAAAEAAGAIEILVRAVAANRRALLHFRPLFPDLGRIVKDPWLTGLPPIDPGAAVDALSLDQTVSVRLDPDFRSPSIRTGRSERATLTALSCGSHVAVLELAWCAARTNALSSSRSWSRGGPPHAGRARCDGPLRDLPNFAERLEAKRTEVKELLDEGRTLVEADRTARLSAVRAAARSRRGGARPRRQPGRVGA
jgi:hypothetical protein